MYYCFGNKDRTCTKVLLIDTVGDILVDNVHLPRFICWFVNL